jgi:histone acetyltransferase (RNA polymerase elongator complex component)
MGHSIMYEMMIQQNRCGHQICPYCRKGFCILDADASTDEILPCEQDALEEGVDFGEK